MTSDTHLHEALTRAGDSNVPLAMRLAALEQARGELHRQLIRACADIFPDVAWELGDPDRMFDDGPTLQFPMQGGPDRRLTPERDAALRSLGFVWLGQVRLGIVADEPARPDAPLGSDRID
jgi:hypothetical protein